ncbi:hypothetical protein BH10PSE17_BH10PSE17_09160 [soil metagenome]
MPSFDTLADHWPRLDALLDEALELPVDDHAGWLANLTGDAAGLRETLRKLLSAHAEANTQDWLGEMPQLDPVVLDLVVAGEPRRGDLVGPYVLTSMLGTGGMGAVWLAQRADGQIKRPVALKLPHVVWGGSFAERLARERDILATLSNDHIARLYDAGVDAHGRPYLAMEYVEGVPIDVWCREHDSSINQRIALLLQVAEAVSHAHARLVVHRDLKPANILVTADGQVRLLDFGIAKLMEGEVTAETALTQVSGRAMTRDYASPEQIRGEPLGTSSDVYSLGVVAYELLAGRRPYRIKRGTAAELEEAIASADAPLASAVVSDAALKRQLRGDLDSILRHALRKHSAARYTTIDAFAQDLRRYLEHKPVLAQPDSLGYRVSKFIGRYRLPVAAASVALLAVLAGAGVALWQAREAQLSAQRARDETATARAVQQFLESIFRANSGDQVDPKQGREMSARQLLDAGAERIGNELADAPQVRLELLKTLSNMYYDLDIRDRAMELAQQRVDIARSSFGERSSQLADALVGAAFSLNSLDRHDEAERSLTQAEAILDALQDLRSSTRRDLELTRAGLLLRTDPEQGYAAAQRALPLARDFPVSPDLVRALQLVADNASSIGRFKEAEAACEEAIAIIDAHPTFGISDKGYLLALLADAQRRGRKLAQAESTFLKSVELERTRGSSDLRTHLMEAQLGGFYYDYGRYAQSVQITRPGYEWARALPKERWGHEPPFVVIGHGRALIGYGHIEQGLSVLDEADTMIGANPAFDAMQVPMLSPRIAALIDQGRYADARTVLSRAEQMVKGLGKGQASFLDGVRRSLLVNTGNGAQALADFRQWRIDHKMSAEPAQGDSPRLWLISAYLQLSSGDAAAAVGAARIALAALQADPSPLYVQSDMALASLVLGRALLESDQARDAVPILQQAVAGYRTVVDPAVGLPLSDALVYLARAARATGAPDTADRALAEAARIRSTHPSIGPHHPAR